MNDCKSTSAGNDSTWAQEPTTAEWNTAANWVPAELPTETAQFGTSSRTEISLSPKGTTVQKIVFAADAPAYTFRFDAPAVKNAALTIAGQGIDNKSASIQSFVVASTAVAYENAQLKFKNSATAGGPNTSYSVGPTTPESAGGGVIGFYDDSTAGSASFTVTTGAGTPPKENSTVGGEVSFSDCSSAGTSRFMIYGSTSLTDGDTFGNTVFHDTATAAQGVFTTAGGTVSGGDGGNTQFYNSSTAANGLFHNMGGTHNKANGGDVAFDGTSSASYGNFHNYAATACGGYGGVTSFNNNYPYMNENEGASAANASCYNYGAKSSGEGGGHTFFTAKYGSPTAADGNFYNYGSAVSGSSSSAGHTVFSISLPQTEHDYFPTAGSATFWNLPGTADYAPGGYTEFTVYADNPKDPQGKNRPTAGDGTFINFGGATRGALGGATKFSGQVTAENALLIAYGGSNGGDGGRIEFENGASGGSAKVQLTGNGVLDLTYQAGVLTIDELELNGGTIESSVGTETTCLALTGNLVLNTDRMYFFFKNGDGFKHDTPYKVLTASNLGSFDVEQFAGNHVKHGSPIFTIDGNDLMVSFSV